MSVARSGNQAHREDKKEGLLFRQDLTKSDVLREKNAAKDKAGNSTKVFLTYSVDPWLMQCHYLFADDWFGDRSINQYFLGEMIYVEASVSRHKHVPLFVYVEYCEATISGYDEKYRLIDSNG